MALNIKNVEVERLAAEVARLAHETKTEAIRRALQDRRARLQLTRGRPKPKGWLREHFERSVWPNIPAEARGRPLTREEKDAILGYGPEGY